MKDFVDRHVATGVTASEADFVGEAVRRYAGHLEDDESDLVAAAEEGIAASQRGDYVTISGPEDVAALRGRVWARAMVLAEQMRAAQPAREDEVRTETQAGE